MKQLRLLLLSLSLCLALPVAATGVDTSPDRLQEGIHIQASVYPNPTQGVFYLQIDSQAQMSYQVNVVNLVGQTVERREVPANQQNRFDLSNLPKGVYFIKIQVDQQKVIKRVILQ